MARLPALASVVVVLALAALSAAGCGEQRAEPPDAGSDGSVDPIASSPTVFQADVTAVETLPDGTGFTFVVRVPDGPDADCAGEVSARQDSLENRIHYVTTTVLSSSAYGDCPDLAERRVDLLVEPGGLDVAVNQELWTPGPDGATYVRCSPELGCHPPEDRCDPVWTQLLNDGAELPPEKRVDVLGCSDGWLVADVDAVVTGCQSVDGAAPPSGCAGSGVHVRWFARLGADDLWEVVASGDAAGCADVHASVPEFPEELCAGLPARAAS